MSLTECIDIGSAIFASVGLSTRAAPSCLPLQSWLRDAANTFSDINGPFSLGYAILTASLLAAGIGYIVAPGITLPGVSATLCTQFSLLTAYVNGNFCRCSVVLCMPCIVLKAIKVLSVLPLLLLVTGSCVLHYLQGSG